MPARRPRSLQAEDLEPAVCPDCAAELDVDGSCPRCDADPDDGYDRLEVA